MAKKKRNKKRTIQSDVGLRLNTPAPRIIKSKKRRTLDRLSRDEMKQRGDV